MIGESVIGQTSGAHAIVAVKQTDSKIAFLPKNQISFKEGEVVVFGESKVRGSIVTLDTPSKDISNLHLQMDRMENSIIMEFLIERMRKKHLRGRL